ncbi:YhbY family RNA-binding protein [Candidatus Woesearchaeota archaeon]|nr:YhbY family RNA-binding protein [Candidatus Woesearchaeota archaeon]
MTTFKKIMAEKAKYIQPILRIGKAGVTEGAIEEIKRQLKKRKLIKIKLLKSALNGKDKKEMAKEIAEKTRSELIHQVGSVIVLNKK